MHLKEVLTSATSVQRYVMKLQELESAEESPVSLFHFERNCLENRKETFTGHSIFLSVNNNLYKVNKKFVFWILPSVPEEGIAALNILSLAVGD